MRRSGLPVFLLLPALLLALMKVVPALAADHGADVTGENIYLPFLVNPASATPEPPPAQHQP